MGKAVRIVIPLVVGVVSSIPCGGNFIFADFETIQCQFCTKMPEMSDLCCLGKTRLDSLKHQVSTLTFCLDFSAMWLHFFFTFQPSATLITFHVWFDFR